MAATLTTTFRKLTALSLLTTAAFATSAIRAQDGPPPPAPLPDGAIATGLNNPRGITYNPDGVLVVAEAGTGGTTPIQGQFGPAVFGGSAQITAVGADGTLTILVPGLPSRDEGGEVSGANTVAFHDGLTWISTGQGPSSNPFTYGVVALDSNNRVVHFIDTFAAESAQNPDGDVVDSNPVDLAFGSDGTLYIADAGANTVWQWSADSQDEDDEDEDNSGSGSSNSGSGNSDDDGEDTASSLSVFAVWTDNPVPTSVTLDHDGNIYVGFLTGFPFPESGSRVEQYNAAGDLTYTYAGLTTVVDLLWNEGLYAVEFGTFGDFGWNQNTGRVVQFDEAGAFTPVANNINLPYGLAVSPDAQVVVAVNSAYSGAGNGGVVPLNVFGVTDDNRALLRPTVDPNVVVTVTPAAAEPVATPESTPGV